MNDHNGHVDKPRMADGVVRGLALRDLGMVEHCGSPQRLMASGQVLDGVMPLGVNHHQRLFPAGNLEHVQQLCIVKDQIVTGHEDLERGVAVPHQSGQPLPQHLWGRNGDDQVKKDVRMAVPHGLVAIVLDSRAQGLTPDLKGEGQDGRVPARGRRSGAADKAVPITMRSDVGWSGCTWH